MALSLGVVLPACGEDGDDNDTATTAIGTTTSTTDADTTGDSGDGDGDTTETTGDGDAGTTETTGDGDGGETTGSEMCNADDPYCLSNGCVDVMGQGLLLDIDMDMVNDFGFCQHTCTASTDCPAQPGTGTPTCSAWNAEGDMACFLICDPADAGSCGPGATCYMNGSTAICVYDASGF